MARTPPESLKKAVRNLDEELNESKKLKDVGANSHVETREEVNRRNIAEVKDCMDVEETEENPNVIPDETCLNIPDSDEAGKSSEGSSEDESEEDSGDEENSELIDEAFSIGKRLDSMVSSNAVEEEIGLDLMKTLSNLPITYEILKVTRIGRSVNQFHVCCKNKEIVKLGRSLLLSWQKIVAEAEKMKLNQNKRKNTLTPYKAKPMRK